MEPQRLQALQRKYLRGLCTCAAQLPGDCHLRSFGVMLVDDDDEIVRADAEAVEALRGPLEEWDGAQARPLHDGSAAGPLCRYWTLIERLGVGAAPDMHHYLVVRRSDDGAVVWVQTCIHPMAAADGRTLHVWHVQDVSASARCLGLSRAPAAGGESALALEDDGMPHLPLLTRAPDARPPSDPAPRAQLAGLLADAVASEGFAVLRLTGFGAVDSVFPRRLLGWDEPDLLDRSFIGLLCPDDRAFFCGALRRCHHDGLPQRLALKLAPARAEPGHFLGCDVTVLLPEAVQLPVLVVRATAPEWQRPRPHSHAVCRVQLGAAHVPPPAPAHKPALQGGTADVPPGFGEAATLAPHVAGYSDLLAPLALGPAAKVIDIPMRDIFAAAPPQLQPCSTPETAHALFAPIAGVLASVGGGGGGSTAAAALARSHLLCAAAAGPAADDHER
ncbi:hypothetical protein H4R18_002417 [Coemansia javaensis]|uniref:PAS domain-containing protein n=1 Tax=Coemansia javaensis TaxID=2761396 RepID=A0A9W8HGT5_9FUNG|nr:hypothetical protein H4R18_002417 [Coemansia javaensis]